MKLKIYRLLMLCMAAVLLPSCKDDDAHYTLEVSPNEQNLTFEAREARQTIKIASSGEWNIHVPDDAAWCTTSHIIGDGNQYINIYVNANNTDTDRNTQIAVSTKGAAIITVNVTQHKNRLPEYEEFIEPDAGGMNPQTTSMELSNALKIGFNVGNTFEAIYKDSEGNLSGDETIWGNPTPNAALFRGIKEAGFNFVRMPLAFSHQLVDPNGYEIKKEWLDKIAKAIDDAIAAELYIMINLHWDGGWMHHINDEHKEALVERYEAYWKQIALRFRNYNDHLLFAGLNEVADEDNGNVWNLPPSAENQRILNELNQLFVNIVRATGGRNYYRHLISQPYLNNIDYAISAYEHPVDVVENRTFVECHFYTPFQFCLATEGYITQWGKPFADAGYEVPGDGDEVAIDQTLKSLKKFTDKNIPVIIGEWGATARVRGELEGEVLERHLDSRNYYYWYVVKTCLRYNLLPVNWDIGLMFNRQTGEQNEISNIDAIMKAVAGEEYIPTSLKTNSY